MQSDFSLRRELQIGVYKLSDTFVQGNFLAGLSEYDYGRSCYFVYDWVADKAGFIVYTEESNDGGNPVRIGSIL